MPHLPNRIPIAYIPRISAALPYDRLLSYSNGMEALHIRTSWSIERRISFFGNLLTFCKPRITTWTKDELKCWLSLLSIEVIALPELNELRRTETSRTVFLDSDSDDDERDSVEVKHIVHPRLLRRLDMLTDKSNITTLIALANKYSSIREQLFSYLAIIIEKYQHRRNDIIHAILDRKSVV